MIVRAPGKLILSGEHAVVYGKPAFAMAVNRYVTANVEDHASTFISLNFADLSYERSITLDALTQLKNQIREKYHRFTQGEFNIRDVLHKPFELAQFALGLCLEMLNIKLTQGLKIHVTSTIPVGCGMGSSAATILSIIHAMASHTGIKVPSQQVYELGLQAENMQHGFSSGLDLHASLYGGCCYKKDNLITAKKIPDFPMYLVNTGSPASSTGECVTEVAHYFQRSSIGDDFASVTNAMVDAVDRHALDDFKFAVRANHELLKHIGVVPGMVQQFIHDIHTIGGAAKICGAGAVHGDHAGIVMVVAQEESALNQLCAQYGYTILPVSGEMRGVHVVL